MSLADHTLFYKDNPNSHVVVTYSDFRKLNDLVATFFNEGLKRGQLCVYCSMDVDGQTTKDLSSKIKDFEKNVSEGNLLIVDLTPYYFWAIKDDYGRFEVLKKLVSMKLRSRKDKHVRLCGELTDHLFENEFYEQCIELEKFWQKNPFDGTTICPFRRKVIEAERAYDKRELVVQNHDNIILC